MGQNKSVLIVEDELFQAYYLKNTVQRLGHVIVGASERGDKAVEMAVKKKPEIIFMDIALGDGQKGIEAAWEITNILDCFIIFLTGLTNSEILAQAREVPSSTLISKPIKVETLQELIESSSNPVST
jgi:CheY-like chemotaxis protein